MQTRLERGGEEEDEAMETTFELLARLGDALLSPFFLLFFFFADLPIRLRTHLNRYNAQLSEAPREGKTDKEGGGKRSKERQEREAERTAEGVRRLRVDIHVPDSARQNQNDAFCVSHSTNLRI